MNKLSQYIKTVKGDKVEAHRTSVILEKRHEKFLKENNLNLSKIVRDRLDELMKEELEALKIL